MTTSSPKRPLRQRMRQRSESARPCYPSLIRYCEQERILGLENIVKEVKAEIARLQQVLALLGAETGHGVARTTQRKISAAGRKRIAAAQRARWAKIRAGKK